MEEKLDERKPQKRSKIDKKKYMKGIWSQKCFSGIEENRKNEKKILPKKNFVLSGFFW